MSELPPLAPIIKRQDTGAVSNAALRSPVFADEPPSPQGAAGSVTVHAASGYFSPQASTPSPSGILLNKGEGASASSAAAPKSGDALSPGLAPPAGQAHPELHSPTAHHPLPAAHAFLRVASPDGSASESGFSSDGGGPASTAPSSAGSPPAHAKPSLSTLLTGGATTPAAAVAVAGDAGDDSALKRAASPPSPHCHFAPLPKVESDRPGTRRNSFANRVKPYVPRPVERTDTAGSAAVADDDDSHPQSPPGIYSPGDSSIPSASALSQRLSSSLTFAERARPSAGAQHPSQQHLGSSSSPSRPTSRRSSSSRRSRSPSPPGGLRYRSPTGHGHGHASRSHSPNLSRHASTDALSLHYIEGEQRTAHSLSRTSSRAGSERGGGAPAVEWPIGGAAADERQGGGGGGAGIGSRRTSADRTGSHSLSRAASASTAGPGAGTSASGVFVDRDKEADVHRLQDKAAHGNVDAERAVSPALAAQAKRERSGSRGADGAGVGGAEGRPHVLKRKGSSEEVVEVRPGEEKDAQDGGELEEVAEEPEEEEEAENGEDDDEDDDDNERDDEDDDEDDDEEEDEEADRSRDQDDDDEDEEVPHDDERKTSKGAAVEVVRWHRPERDQEREQQTPPSLRVPSPSGQA